MEVLSVHTPVCFDNLPVPWPNVPMSLCHPFPGSQCYNIPNIRQLLDPNVPLTAENMI